MRNQHYLIISKELKRLDNKKNGASEYDIYDECSVNIW